MKGENAFVFVVDDDTSVRESLRNLIRSAGFSVQTFSSAQEFLASQRPQAPSCLVLDVQLPGLSGLDLQQELARGGIQIPIIFISGHGDIPMSVRAMKAGALEFLTKPIKDEDLLDAIQQAIAHDHRARQPQGNTPQPNFEEIVGTSAALKAALKQVEVVAPTESTVCSFWERLAPEKNSSLVRSIPSVLGPAVRSSNSIARRFLQAYWRVNCSVMRKALSLGRWRKG